MNRSSLPLLGLVIPAALLAAWWLAAHSGGIAPVLLPSPEAVWEAFVRMAADGSLAAHIGMSAMRTMTGFVLAAAFGIGCGVWFTVRPAAAAASHFVIEFLRLTPPLALIPVLILWLGIDEAPKIAIVFLSSFFPIYLSALTAVKGIDPKLAEVAELLRFTSAERFRMLTLPAAMPGILAGLAWGSGTAGAPSWVPSSSPPRRGWVFSLRRAPNSARPTSCSSASSRSWGSALRPTP